jgi:Na+-transporting NADH:ubiquinone oxidoreductase subunit NqrC
MQPTANISLFSMSSSAMVFANVAQASLLDDYGADPTDNKQPKKVEQAVNKGKQESSMEPNLRSNYYYPTNKVRYLPRIKKCSDSIPQVALAIGDGDWDSVRDFATVVADDTILPMKLYVSSLTGGGTNVKVGFAKDMMAAAKTFEKNQALLVKSVEKKDAAKASTALENMAEAMLAYRTSGRLLGPDGGGDIPSVDEIRRSTKRFRGEAFEAKVKERDARVAAAAAASK